MIKKKISQLVFLSLLVTSCNTKKEELNVKITNVKDSLTNIHQGNTQDEESKKKPIDFIKKDFTISNEIVNDFNKDGNDDLIIEVKSEKGRKYGFVVLLGSSKGYEKIIDNSNSFTLEENIGDDLTEYSISTKNNSVIVHKSLGRYGFENYNFRYKNNDFELIGFDKSEMTGPIIHSESSINFLTKKKQVKTNMNENSLGGDEIFETSWENIKINKLMKLSEISSFESLEMFNY